MSGPDAVQFFILETLSQMSATVMVAHNAAFTSSSRPSEDTSHSLGNELWRVQVSSFPMISSSRSPALALNNPSVVLESWYFFFYTFSPALIKVASHAPFNTPLFSKLSLSPSLLVCFYFPNIPLQALTIYIIYRQYAQEHRHSHKSVHRELKTIAVK